LMRAATCLFGIREGRSTCSGRGDSTIEEGWRDQDGKMRRTYHLCVASGGMVEGWINGDGGKQVTRAASGRELKQLYEVASNDGAGKGCTQTEGRPARKSETANLGVTSRDLDASRHDVMVEGDPGSPRLGSLVPTRGVLNLFIHSGICMLGSLPLANGHLQCLILLLPPLNWPRRPAGVA
jgi:hypothetical protein